MADHVRFTETMAGWLSPAVDRTHEDAARAGRDGGGDGMFVLTVVTHDVEGFLVDPRHRSPAYGCVLIPALHPAPLRVLDGHLDLFVDTELGSRIVHMRYGLSLATEDGARWYLRGIKEVVRRAWWPTVAVDTTTLFVDVFPGESATGAPRLRGIFTMGPGGVLAQGLSFRGAGGWLGLRGIARYLAYYARRVVHVYFGPRTAPLRPRWAAPPTTPG